MNHSSIRLVPLLIGALALAACADHNARTTSGNTRTTVSSTPASSSSSKPRVTSTTTSGSTSRTTSRTATATKDAPLPDSTGIAACDEYLASYKSCHLAAGIFARDQIDSRYDMMRTSLLRQSQDPDMRGQLGARCASLASQLKDALHGKSCADTPAPASTR
ncbi:hypothetical protein [Luteibacter sp. ME-Dv--P-043b]|uniref:hypothetical protein n=1 Tax=unclassified Luteibacter TaxID=2620188 RepID=UPI0025570026|nr:hypothetical protein [Luteibacter sp. ME-Dv--P-043b]